MLNLLARLNTQFVKLLVGLACDRLEIPCNFFPSNPQTQSKANSPLYLLVASYAQAKDGEFHRPRAETALFVHASGWCLGDGSSYKFTNHPNLLQDYFSINELV
jgi:hypothetical protein